MKFAHPLNETFSYSRKLPKETEIEQYMDQFIITDPYAASFEILSNVVNRIGEWTTPINIRNVWIGASFEHSTDISNIANSLVTQLPADTNGNWNGIGSGFRANWDRKISGYRSHRTLHITRANQMEWNIRTIVTSSCKRYQKEQMNSFLHALNTQGYLKKRNEFELFKELKTRRKQYPGEPAYILLGASTSDWMTNIYESATWEGATLLDFQGLYNGFGGDNTNSINAWHSAVFVKSQIKSSHSISFAYITERQSRKWRVEWASYANFRLEVDKLSQEDKVIRSFDLDRFTIE